MTRQRKLISYCRDHLKLYFVYCERCLTRYERRAYSWGEYETRRSIEANLIGQYKKYKNKIGHAGYAQIVYNLAKQIKDKKL